MLSSACALCCLLAACGAASSISPTPSPTAAAATATPAPTPSATPGLHPLELVAPSIGLDVTATTDSPACDNFVSVLPTDSTLIYGDMCATFIAAAGGPLDPLLSAPAGTLVKWFDAGGTAHHTTLTGTVSTLARDPNGDYEGHGIPSPLALFWVRDSTQEKEVSGPLSSG